MKTAMLGVGLTIVVTALLCSVWGLDALVAGVSFGLLATAIQVAAVAVLKKGWQGKFAEVLARFGLGMGLRLAGVATLAVVASLWPEVFPPLPSALAFLGVLIPLLYLELKLIK